MRRRRVASCLSMVVGIGVATWMQAADQEPAPQLLAADQAAPAETAGPPTGCEP